MRNKNLVYMSWVRFVVKSAISLKSPMCQIFVPKYFSLPCIKCNWAMQIPFHICCKLHKCHKIFQDGKEPNYILKKNRVIQNCCCYYLNKSKQNTAFQLFCLKNYSLVRKTPPANLLADQTWLIWFHPKETIFFLSFLLLILLKVKLTSSHHFS